MIVMHNPIGPTHKTEKSERASLLTDLVRAAKSGDLSTEQQSHFWKTVADISLRHLNLRFRNLSTEDREDISQKVAIKLCQDPSLFSDPTAATSFVQTCAFNEARSYTRTARRRNELAPSLSIEEFNTRLQDLRIKSPEETLIAREELEQMQGAFALLTADQTMTVKMRLGGASMDEISEQAQRPVGTVKRWAHEATKKLHAALLGKI